MSKKKLLFAGIALCLSPPAFAEPAYTEAGLGLSGGVGIAGFTDDAMRDYATEAPTWEARVKYGTHNQRFTLEAGYIGSWQEIDALGLDSGAQLVGTTFEGALRMNFTESAFQPYVIVGGAWTRYDLTSADINTSDVTEADQVFHLPMGAGMVYRWNELLLDVRAEFRPAFDSDLIARGGGDLDVWRAVFNGGVEF
jgi:hypothetical protein